MKTLAAAVLMIAVSAWGQPATSKAVGIPLVSIYDPPCKAPDKLRHISIGEGVHSYCVHPEKTHKPKPSATCAGKDCLVSSHIDPCDGWSCTKPVEVLEAHKKEVCAPGSPKDKNDACYTTMMVPDKAAVPVEPAHNTGIDWANITTTTIEPIPSHVSVSAQILAKDGTLAVMLSDSEYSHLQELRTAVVEEEKRLAVKYGAFLRDAKCASAPVCISMWDDDHYEYKGQFLLIDKGGK